MSTYYLSLNCLPFSVCLLYATISSGKCTQSEVTWRNHLGSGKKPKKQPLFSCMKCLQQRLDQRWSNDVVFFPLYHGSKWSLKPASKPDTKPPLSHPPSLGWHLHRKRSHVCQKKSKDEPRPSGGSRVQLGFSPSLDAVVLMGRPSQTWSSTRTHSHDTMGSLVMTKGSFQLLLMMKGGPNYFQPVSEALVMSFLSSPFPREKFPSGTEVKQNQSLWLTFETVHFSPGESLPRNIIVALDEHSNKAII